MKRILTIIASFCFFLIPSTAYACSCATGDPPAEFNRAQAIFIGQMLRGTEKLSEKDDKGKAYKLEAGAVKFIVEEVFKGTVVGEVTIEIASMAGTSCGPYGLKRGERYLVYAYGSEQDANVLYSGVCTRTQPVSSKYAKEDMEFLRNLPPAGTGGNLRGSVWADIKAASGGSAAPLPNVRVNIRSADNQVITVTTDAEGKFEAKKLKAGKYQVEPEFPEHYVSEHTSEEVTIDDRGTANVGFEAYLNGRVLGRVLDKDGQGFNRISMTLSSDDKRVYAHSTGENGEFEAQGVPPGEYVLSLELRHADYNQKRTFYYPGTSAREEAVVIKIGLGETVQGLEFTLPEEFKVRTVSGRVVFADGQPAASVDVMLLCPRNTKPDGFYVEYSPTSRQTDEQGRFQLEGLTGESYWLEARGSKKSDRKDEPIELHSPSKQIVVSENLSDIKVVLSEKGYSGECQK